MSETGCIGCAGVGPGVEPCKAILDVAELPMAIELNESWFLCSREKGHEKPHMACCIPRPPYWYNSGWSIRKEEGESTWGLGGCIERHPAYTWNGDGSPPNFSTLKAELAWLEGDAVL